MKFLANRKTALVAGLLYGLTAGVPLHAEDTEIYVGLSNTQSAAEPNVLFVIDTSGSMTSAVTILNPTAVYDPATAYAGTCQTDRIYWDTSGNVPTCGTAQWFNLSQFRCDNAVVALDTLKAGVGAGFYQDRVARFRTHSSPNRNRWRTLSTNVNNPPHVECRGDDGTHGEFTADTRLYIQNGVPADPWTSNQNQGLNWNSTGDFYTLYSGNYMNWANGTGAPTYSTRIDVVKQVVKDLIDANQALRVGLMRFDDGCDNFGGPVIHEMADIDNAGVKTSLKNTVDTLTATGCTPLAEAMYEALQFYRGQNVYFGNSPNLQSIQTVREQPGNTKYISPIAYECQKNFVVMLTDGDPVDDDDGDTVINTLLNTASGLTLGNCGFPGDDCLDELAEFGYNVDNATLALGNDIPNNQNIITYTVGFATNQTLLDSAAQNGGGKYYVANDVQQLSNAFTQIISQIQAVNTTFTAPAVSVNAFNRVTHRKELYFTLFKPALTSGWPGNVKRFELDYVLDGFGNPIDSDSDGIPDPPEILDVNGVPAAVDPNTGFFKGSVTSYWTQAADAPDGDETRKGGAASMLPEVPVNRIVYTNVGGVNDLSDVSNALHESNALVTNALLNLTGGAGEPTRNTLIQWARGVDTEDDDSDGSTTDGRKEMGDPLHAKPLLVTYGGTQASPDITMFALTNDGYLHAIDIDDGTEVFSFVPKELLGKLKIVYDNAAANHNYGLDGGIEVWVKDHNDNGVIETPDINGDNDHVYLYFGQRRGGTNYYALDVTDRSAPKLLWHIQGAVAGNFLELSDTWSTPTYHRIKVKSGSSLVPQDVILFGGGYDDEQDNNTTRLADDEGRAIYMVDAVTGSLLWWAGKQGLTGPTPDLQLADMDYSIPSGLRVLDVNTDGFADRVYVGDMGGQMWRFDIDNSVVDTISNRITGGVIADLQKVNAAATPGSADNRRFYSPPDVALIQIPNGQDFLSLAIGSGYRAHPLNTTIEDRFYLIKDFDIYQPPMSGSPTPVITYSAITEDDLDDRTNLGVVSTKPRGWYIKLNNINNGTFEGEKVLAEPLTFDGQVLFTTFTPVASGSQSACSPSQGTAKLYQVDVVTAAPLQNLDNLGSSTNLTRTDRSLTLVRTGIPPEVTILFPGLAQADPVALVGAEQVGLTLSQTAVRTYWFQEQN